MLDSNDLLEIIKQIAVNAMDSSKPSELTFGNVISDAPLKIQVEQKMTLGTEQLVLTRNVTDYKVSMTVDHLTENRGGGGGESAYESHNHEYKGKKEFLVHHALKVGEEVLLLRQQGGQKFIVIDRVVSE